MTYSMTAFGHASCKTRAGVLTWELRSVNHRYLELGLRLPEELRAIDPDVRQAIGARLTRGKIDAQLRLQSAEETGSELSVDMDRVDRLAAISRQIADRIGTESGLRVADLMRWPGVLRAPEMDPQALAAAAMELLAQALDEFIATRQREGERIRELIDQRIASAREVAVEIRALMPDLRESYRQRLLDRLQEAQDKLDPQRLEQELVLFAQKADVDEELDRLLAHLDEVARVVSEGGSVGRRLDFLMQELNREANTLGSKAVDIRMTNASVELKVLIEQMREQIQNVE